MIKIYCMLALICLIELSYADNLHSEVGAASVSGMVSNSSQYGIKQRNIPVKFTSYDYKLSPIQFKKFLIANNLKHTQITLHQKNIIYLSLINSKELNKMNQKFSKYFSNINTGSTICGINSGVCQAASSSEVNNNEVISRILSVNPFYNQRMVSVEVTGLYKTNKPIVSSDFLISLKNVVNSNYIVISQIPQGGLLYGQVILISFGQVK